MGASFDENWSGGWDEVFPNDAGGAFRGRNLADHGELWSRNWRVTESSGSEVRLACDCSTLPAACEKRIAVTAEGLTVGYRLQNLSGEALPFLFKLHPALAIEPGDEILLPPCRVEIRRHRLQHDHRNGRKRRAFPWRAERTEKKCASTWFRGGKSGSREFFYTTGLEGPWCGLKNSRTGRTLSFSFDAAGYPMSGSSQAMAAGRATTCSYWSHARTYPMTSKPPSPTGRAQSFNPHELREIEVRVTLSGGAVRP